MSQSSLQVLLHTGELEYIVKTINEPRRKHEFVGGCLFGLWRNSLKQPVIQFVTGPGAEFKPGTKIGKLFKNRSIDTNVEIMWKNHCLLHLGFWFFGSQEHQVQAAKEIVFDDNNYNVLLTINLGQDSNGQTLLTGEYHLKKDGGSTTSKLFKEDVLPEHSSFRLYEPLTDKIGGDSSPANSEVGSQITELVDSLASRVEVEEAVTHQEQWYSSDEGMQLLQLLFQIFKSANIEVQMSRDANTHNFQFDLSGGYCLDFPVDFPRRWPRLSSPDGQPVKVNYRYDHTGTSEDICYTVVTGVANVLQNRGRGNTKH